MICARDSNLCNVYNEVARMNQINVSLNRILIFTCSNKDILSSSQIRLLHLFVSFICRWWEYWHTHLLSRPLHASLEISIHGRIDANFRPHFARIDGIHIVIDGNVHIDAFYTHPLYKIQHFLAITRIDTATFHQYQVRKQIWNFKIFFFPIFVLEFLSWYLPMSGVLLVRSKNRMRHKSCWLYKWW